MAFYRTPTTVDRGSSYFKYRGYKRAHRLLVLLLIFLGLYIFITIMYLIAREYLFDTLRSIDFLNLLGLLENLFYFMNEGYLTFAIIIFICMFILSRMVKRAKNKSYVEAFS